MYKKEGIKEKRTTIAISHSTWGIVNSEKQVGEDFNDTIRRVFEEWISNGK